MNNEHYPKFQSPQEEIIWLQGEVEAALRDAAFERNRLRLREDHAAWEKQWNGLHARESARMRERVRVLERGIAVLVERIKDIPGLGTEINTLLMTSGISNFQSQISNPAALTAAEHNAFPRGRWTE